MLGRLKWAGKRKAGAAPATPGSDRLAIPAPGFDEALYLKLNPDVAAKVEAEPQTSGWRYFIEKTDLKAGTDPAEATQHRQAELEGRESKALQEVKPPNFPLPDRQR